MEPPAGSVLKNGVWHYRPALSPQPVLRLTHDYFTVDAADVTHLRGLVDLFDGARHVRQCLIIASDVEGGELICTMKWSRIVTETAPLDYVRDENAPVGYLPRF